MRIYDPHLRRFLSVDRITNDDPELSPYQFASNSPVSYVDFDGGGAGNSQNLNYLLLFLGILVTY
jgi:hypothetical protein